ncbi:TetR/AcrR family transcriptional regulator [Paenibacillus sp. YIM B09110]|uniref:TetR/AcrR family transcriptional regulator n=1 Tax=Paenibacillus sp. YIM B09110 TaxID=3126102 RepID=UPI00301D936E
MDSKEMNKDPQNEMRNKLVMKVIPIVRKNGFQALRMEAISKHMDVSKATMYKYFSSKEEIMNSAVDVLIEFINELVVVSEDSVESFGAGFQQLFEQSVLLAAYISEGFLNELQLIYPDIHIRLSDAMVAREKRILAFYQEGKSRDIFNEFNGNLILLQGHVLVRAMLDMKFLMTYRMTLGEILTEYYKLTKHQLFKSEQLNAADDSAMAAKIEHIANKIARDLF